MRSLLGALLLGFTVAACGTQAPSPSPKKDGPPAPTLQPIPANLSGIPGSEEFTAQITPQSPRGELTLGEARDYTIGHCGLGSPIDIDGSLWDPIGTTAALTEDQEGELINSTPTVVVLIDANTMEMATPAGALITLTRHHGPRRYYLCD